MSVSVSGGQIVGIGFFAWMIVALAFASGGLREGSLLYRATSTERIYRARLGSRLFGAMLGLLFTVGTPLMYASEALKPGRHGESMPGWGWLSFALLISMNFAVGGLMFWLSGPNEIRLRLDRRTYRHVYGWPFRPTIHEGTWEDMAGVYVRPIKRDGSYRVGIAWKRERGRCPTLGKFNRSERADRFADEITAALGLPRVEPPPLGKSSTSVPARIR